MAPIPMMIIQKKGGACKSPFFYFLLNIGTVLIKIKLQQNYN